jgi:alpha-galactosidase
MAAHSQKASLWSSFLGLAAVSIATSCGSSSGKSSDTGGGSGSAGAAGTDDSSDSGSSDSGTADVADAAPLSDAGPLIIDDDFPLPLAAGLAPTPPMGWNSWNAFHCGVTAAVIQRTADIIDRSGLRAAGYTFINIDDCWAQTDRAADGTVQVGTNFPGGIQAMADYVHAKGMKLGVYSDRGTQTCGGRAGSQDHELQDAQTYASWGVDYLKYDNCNATLDIVTQYQSMRDALQTATAATGRPIVFSICSWSFAEWQLGIGQLWRTTSDISDTWGSILSNVAINRSLAAYAGPNGWNDPDMLEVGNGSTTDAEDRAHFSMWSIMAAPLIAGNDMTTMPQSTLDILANKEVIDVDQDALGIQGVPIQNSATQQIWVKPLNASGARAVVLLNAGTTATDMTVRIADIGLRPGGASVRDLWAHADKGTVDDSYTVNVASHDVAMLKITGSELPAPSGSVFLSDLPWMYAASAGGYVTRDKRNGSTAGIAIGGQAYDKGLGVFAGSMILYRLGRACSTFSADVGVDSQGAGGGSVVFQVFADGEKLFDSGVVTGAMPAQSISVDVTAKRRLKLLATNAGDGTTNDYADWGNAKLDCAP